MMQTRAMSAGVLAALALVAVFCVFQFDEHVAEELTGNARLMAQKNAILAIEKAKKKGKDLDSVDDMVRGFTAEPKMVLDKSFQEALASQAPQKDSLAAAFSPEALGIVKRAPNGLLQFNDDMSLVQTDEDYSNWTPGANNDIAAQIASAKQAQKEHDRAEDKKLMGDSLIAAASAVNQHFDPKNVMQSTIEAKDLMFVQTEATWEPMGQPGMKDAISSAHVTDEKDAIAEDDLEDDVVVQAINKKNKDEGWNGEDLDLGFVQTSATQWKPQGQPGLADTISQANADQQHQQDVEDGIEGDDILTGAGLAKETSLIQRPPTVSTWSPAPMHVSKKKQMAHPLRQAAFEDAESIVAKREMAAWEKNPEPEDDLGDTVLAAAGLSHHMLKGNMADRAGVMTGDELSIDDLLN